MLTCVLVVEGSLHKNTHEIENVIVQRINPFYLNYTNKDNLFEKKKTVFMHAAYTNAQSVWPNNTADLNAFLVNRIKITTHLSEELYLLSILFETLEDNVSHNF